MRRVLGPVIILLALATGCQVETPIERGRYLVDAVAACAICHTPRAPSGPLLSGGTKFGDGETAVLAPNITPDVETGIGGWSDRQIIDAIRLDVRPDGSIIGPPMPGRAFGAISDPDAAAIVAYLRGIPPIRHEVARSPGRMILLDASSRSAPAPTASRPAPAPMEGGAYLVNGPAHCSTCHGRGETDAENDKPKIFKGPWGAVVAPRLTSGLMSTYSDAELARIVTKGIRPDGRELVGPMPVKAYAGLKPEDVVAILAYLRR